MTHFLCLGDSITDCGRLLDHPPLGSGYVELLSRRLNRTENSFSVTNRGVDGFTVERLLENTVRGYLPLHPDIITILIGINDIGLMMNTDRTPGQQKAMMEQFFQKYETLVQLLLPETKEIILMEPFIFPWPLEYRNWIPLVETMSQGIRALAVQYRLPYLPLHHSLNEEARRYGLNEMTVDGIHLTARGHEFLADRLLSVLNELHVQQKS